VRCETDADTDAEADAHTDADADTDAERDVRCQTCDDVYQILATTYRMRSFVQAS